MTELSAVPKVLDLDMYAGDDFNLKLSRKDATGAPISLVGTYSADIQDATGEVAESFTVDSSGSSGGVLVLSLDKTQTRALYDSDPPFFRGRYDVQWTNGTGSVLTLLKGGITCTGDISA